MDYLKKQANARGTWQDMHRKQNQLTDHIKKRIFEIPSVDKINLAIITLVSFVLIFIWFRKGLLLAYTDIGLIFYNPERWFNIVRYVWFDTQSMGLFFPQGMYIPLAGILTIAQKMGISPVNIQRIFFFFCLMLTGTSMYYLTSTLVKGKIRPMASLLAGLFYMLNTYTLLHIWVKFNSTIWSMLVIPFLLGLYITGLKTKSSAYAILFGFMTLLFSSAFPNPAFDAMIIFVILFYFVFHVFYNIKNSREIFDALKFTALILMVSIILNLWWILPWLSSFGSVYASQGSIPSYANFQILSQAYDLGHLFSLTRTKMLPWLFPYSTNLIFIGFLIPVMVFSALLFKSKNRPILYFASLILIGLFIGKGLQPPFGGLSDWLFKNIPGFIIFRNPFEKAGVLVVLGYSFLFGVGVTSIYQHIGGNTEQKNITHIRKIAAKTFLLLTIFLILIIQVWPMWTGNLFGHDPLGANTKDVFVEVPPYYTQASTYLNSKDEEFRVLVLPLSPGDNAYYNWKHGYSGKEPTYMFYNKPTIAMRTYNNLLDEITINKIPSLITQPSKVDLWKIFDLFNIKYVIVNYDTNHTLLSVEPPAVFADAIQYQRIVDPNASIRLTVLSPSNFWVPGGVGNTIISVEEGTNLRINTTMQAGRWEGGINYVFPEPINISHDELFFKLKIKETDGIEEVRLKIYDTDGNWRMWSISPPKQDIWQQFFLRLENPKFTSEKPFSASKIHSVYLSFISKPNISIDTSWLFDGLYLPSYAKSTRSYMTEDRIFGNITLFKLEDGYFLERIYAAKEMIFVKDRDRLFAEIEKDYFTPKTSILFVEDQLSPEMKGELKTINATDMRTLPNIKFEKKSPVVYNVKIENASNPYFLVFSETYDNWWVAYVDGNKIDRHFIVNGYSNAWYVDKTGSYDVTIKFRGQDWFNYSAIVSIIGFILSIFYIIRNITAEEHIK